MFKIEITELILDFITTLVTSWPFIILVIVVFFHKEIGDNVTKIFDLLTRLKSFSAGDKTINFSEQLANIDHDNEGKTQQENILEPKPEWGFTPQDEFEKLALLRPDFAILDSWRPIEERLYQLSRKYNIEANFFSATRSLKELVEMKMINKSHFNYIRELMLLRNNIVHNKYHYITSKDAYSYRENCMEIMQILDTMPNTQEDH